MTALKTSWGIGFFRLVKRTVRQALLTLPVCLLVPIPLMAADSDTAYCLENTKGSVFDSKAELRGEHTFLAGNTAAEFNKVIESCERALAAGEKNPALLAGLARAVRVEFRIIHRESKRMAGTSAQRILKHVVTDDPNVWLWIYIIQNRAQFRSPPNIRRRLVELAEAGHPGAIQELGANYFYGLDGFPKNKELGNKYIQKCIVAQTDPWCIYVFILNNMHVPATARLIEEIPTRTPTYEVTAIVLKAYRAAKRCDRNDMRNFTEAAIAYQCPDSYCQTTKHTFVNYHQIRKSVEGEYNSSCRRAPAASGWSGANRGGRDSRQEPMGEIFCRDRGIC